MKRVLRYFPEKRFLKSKIFKRVLFSFAGIVLILFFIFIIYFYYRIYKKEYSDFINRERNESLSTVLSLKALSSELSLSVLYLKDSVKFLNMVNAPFDSLKDLLPLFFRDETIYKELLTYYKEIVIVENESSGIVYNFSTKEIYEIDEEEIKSLKDGKYKCMKDNGLNIHFSINKDKKNYVIYSFSIKNRDVYIKIPLKKIIDYILTGQFKSAVFIYDENENLIYDKRCIEGFVLSLDDIISFPTHFNQDIRIEEKKSFLVIYVPFEIPFFDLSLLYVEVVPIYAGFKWYEYSFVVLIFFIFALLLSLIFSNLIIRQFIYPLQIIKESVVKITQGDFSNYIELSTQDEFEELANAINVMARRLHDLYMNLEEKVKARTEELEKQKYRLKKLYESSFIFFKDKDEMLAVLLKNLMDILDIEMISISHKLPEGWEFLAFIDKDGKIKRPEGEKIEHLYLDEVVYNTKKVFVLEDISKEEKWRETFLKTEIRSYMGVPIFVGKEIYGVLSALNKHPYKFTSEEYEIMALFTHRISYFLETELWQKRIMEKQRELEELNNLLYMKNMELKKLTEDLQRANKAKSNFLANVSHELRTPLNAILGFSEVLLDGYFGDLNSKQKEYVKDILESGKHLLSLINDVLDLSKIEAGKEELHLSRVKLNELVDNVLLLIKEQIFKHNIKVVKFYDKNIGEVMVDELKLKQILFNLFSNAVKFTPDGKKIGVTTKLLDKWYRISVWDTGIGIEKDGLKRLFREFSQLENPYVKKYKGTGLGLAISKKLAEMHGGFIKVVSVYGKGSTFSVYLPKNLKVKLENEK